MSIYSITNNTELFLSHIILTSGGMCCVVRSQPPSQIRDVAWFRSVMFKIQNRPFFLWHYFILMVCCIYWQKKYCTFPRFRYFCTIFISLVYCSPLYYSLFQAIFPYSCWEPQQTGEIHLMPYFPFNYEIMGIFNAYFLYLKRQLQMLKIWFQIQ